jgi:hypothetical protein
MAVPTRGLTAKQRSFIEAYTTPGSETFNNGYQSAIAAGYCHNTAIKATTQIVGNSRVSEAIQVRQAESRRIASIGIEEWRRAQWALYLDAVAAGDRSAANVALRQYGQHIGAFEADNRQRGDATFASLALRLANARKAKQVASITIE